MTLHAWIRKDIERFSFVNRTEFKNARLYIYYTMPDKKERYKTLPYRATKEQVQRVIQNIKLDIGYEEQKRKKDELVKEGMKKKLAMGYSTGETNE